MDRAVSPAPGLSWGWTQQGSPSSEGGPGMCPAPRTRPRAPSTRVGRRTGVRAQPSTARPSEPFPLPRARGLHPWPAPPGPSGDRPVSPRSYRTRRGGTLAGQPQGEPEGREEGGPGWRARGPTDLLQRLEVLAEEAHGAVGPRHAQVHHAVPQHLLDAVPLHVQLAAPQALVLLRVGRRRGHGAGRPAGDTRPLSTPGARPRNTPVAPAARLGAEHGPRTEGSGSASGQGLRPLQAPGPGAARARGNPSRVPACPAPSILAEINGEHPRVRIKNKQTNTPLTWARRLRVTGQTRGRGDVAPATGTWARRAPRGGRAGQPEPSLSAALRGGAPVCAGGEPLRVQRRPGVPARPPAPL